MNIFLDTSKLEVIKNLLPYGIVDGVTTNPSIMVKEGVHIEKASRQISELMYPLPVSVEVCTSDSSEMLRQARLFSGWGSNINIKIPVIDERGRMCLDVVKTLEEEGIPVNCTVCMSFNQAILAAKAGATYISLLVGRINDEGNDGNHVVRITRDFLDAWGYKSKIIAASIRNTLDVQHAALAGSHIITIPPAIMTKMADHRFSRATVEQFIQDGSELIASSLLAIQDA